MTLQISGGPRNDNEFIGDCLSTLCCCLRFLRIGSGKSSKTAQKNQPPSSHELIAQKIKDNTKKIFEQLELRVNPFPKDLNSIIAEYAVDVPILIIKPMNEPHFLLFFIPTETVGDLKERIFNSKAPPLKGKTLLKTGKVLQPDTRPVADYRLLPGDTIYLTP